MNEDIEDTDLDNEAESRLSPHAQAIERIAAALNPEEEEPVVEVLEPEIPEEPAVEAVQEQAHGESLEERLARVEQLNALLYQQLQTQQPQAQPEPEPSHAEPLDARSIYESLMMGDEDAGVEALEQLLNRSQPAPQFVDAAQVSQQAAEQALAQMQYINAQRDYAKANADLAADPDIWNAVVATTNRTAAQSQTYDEAFARAGNLVREHYRAKALSLGLVQESPRDDLAAKRAAKENIDNVVGSRSTRIPVPAVEKEESGSEIVAQMRKARGLT